MVGFLKHLRHAWRLTIFERERLRQLRRRVEDLNDERELMVMLITTQEAWQIAMVESMAHCNIVMEHPTAETKRRYAIDIDAVEMQIRYLQSRIFRRRLHWLFGLP